MTFRRNILASYFSQIYVTAAGIVTVPLYIKYMGAEAFGLVGFFAMLQAVFNLLDLGLTPTIARESARFNGGAISLLEYRRLARALEGVFAVVALVGGAGLFALAQPIAAKWLNVSQLPVFELTHALQIMALIVAFRWMGGFYRGVITGAERLVWLSHFNSFIATVRFLLVLPVLMFVSDTPIAFFGFQLGVAVLELAGLAFMAYRLLPDIPQGERILWQWSPLKPVLKFSLSIAFTSSVWVLITQTDKLILSGILPLAEYGYFTLAVLAASGITMVTGPISTALLPRMARLHAEGDHTEIRRLYNHSSQLVSVIAGSLAVTIALSAEPLLYAWTGNRDVTDAAVPILRLYALGNGLLALGAFPFYLQYARGNLHYHLIGNAVMVAILIPATIAAAVWAGGVGAGWVWFVMNALYLIVWVCYVHSKLEPGLHWKWLNINFLVILIPTLVVGVMLNSFQVDEHSRLLSFVHVAAVAATCMLISTMSSPLLRPAALTIVRAWWDRSFAKK